MKTYSSKIVSCIAYFGLLFSLSCNDLFEVEESNREIGGVYLNGDLTWDEQIKVSDEDVILQTTAQLLSSLVDVDVVKEVKRGVEKSRSYGLDEEIRFIEILQPQNTKVNKFAGNNLLTGKLKECIRNVNKNSLVSAQFTGDEMESFLCNNNVQIYWPYLENWDGKEIPVISYSNYDNEDDDVSDVVAYRRIKDISGKYELESFIINEEYAMNHPVWIISKNEFEYNNLPDFNNGEFKKNGIIFAQETTDETNSIKSDSPNEVSLRAGSNLFFLKTLQVTTNHDNWINGGSEFEFHWASLYSTTVIRYCISRSDINKGKKFTLYYALNTNWTWEQQSNALLIIETDANWGDNYWYYTIHWRDDYNFFSSSRHIYHNQFDDFIHGGVYWRDIITSNGYIESFFSDGVRWTMNF
ncbi:MAG: hypothetical protein LBS79_02200 [Tannerella sp.]|jgi:hypothetical protein|nr:hypothetical protein [Tannerella sp.]